MLRENLRIFKGLVYAADLCLVALGFQLAVWVESARLGAIGYLPKPFTPKELLMKISEVLGNDQ